MTLDIRNPKAAALAQRIAEMDDTSPTDAVIDALEEAVVERLRRQSRRNTARRILARHNSRAVPSDRLGYPLVAEDGTRRPSIAAEG